MATPQRVQLPKNVRPLKYRITLTPDLERFTFRGEEAVDVEVLEPGSTVVLNANELQVQAASLAKEGGAGIPAREITYDHASETVALHFASPIPRGRARLSLQFTGELNDRLLGFYRSTYKTEAGETKVMAATQFEATDARRAFPCWDEPAVKAVFELALVIPARLTAVSNTSITSEAPAGPGLKRVQFRETPRMSAYLLAFVVGEMESIEARSPEGTLVRVWATPGKAEQGRFALDVAVRLLGYYNGYFGVPYPLEKLDHLAIPDFAAGAMENWGAITYRETALLFDPKNSSPMTRQRIADVVAHEMAHMWFGDLVTMEWWNDLWLNESFASWMGTKAVDHLFPEWDMWTQFIVHDVNAGLGLDGLENTHPIEQEVRDPAEINQLFDAISYSKGASILRMLEQFLGPDQFQKGLRRYISAYAYGNARGHDLWQALQEETGQPVVALMESWINQAGYPVLQADIQRKAGRATVRLSQQRFLYSGPNQDPTIWQVPVTVAAKGAKDTASMILGTREGAIQAPRSASRGGDYWVKANARTTGFYRVQYKEEEWARLIPSVQSQELPAADRLGLQEDAYALARAGLIPATQFLDLAKAYVNEQEYAVWADLTGNLGRLDTLLSREPYHAKVQAFGRELLTPIARKVGWRPKKDEGHLQTLLRSTVLGQIGYLGDADTLREAGDRFMRYLEEPSSLSPDLKGVVYGLAAQAGDGATYSAIQRLARDASFQEEKVRLQMALARFRDPKLLERTLEFSLSQEVRSQDTVSIVGALAENPANGRRQTWDFVKRNWKEFDRRYGAGGFVIMRLVSFTGGFTTPEMRQDVEEFFKKNPTPTASRTIQQSLERMGLNIKWLERNRADLARWFGS